MGWVPAVFLSFSRQCTWCTTWPSDKMVEKPTLERLITRSFRDISENFPIIGGFGRGPSSRCRVGPGINLHDLARVPWVG